MAAPDDTPALVAAAVGGDRAAAGVLVDRLRGFARRVARQYARDHSGVGADDLAAAGLVGVLQAAERFDPALAGGSRWLVCDPAAPAGEAWLTARPGRDIRRAWLAYARAACAREVAREARRQAARRLPSDAGLAAAPARAEFDPEAAADRQAVTDRVRAALESLPDRQRRLVVAVHGLDGPPATIEAARRPLRLNRRKAMAELAAARDALRAVLGAWFG